MARVGYPPLGVCAGAVCFAAVVVAEGAAVVGVECCLAAFGLQQFEAGYWPVVGDGGGCCAACWPLAGVVCAGEYGGAGVVAPFG